MSTEEDRAWLPSLADIDGNEILLADRAVRGRLDHMVRQEVPCVLRTVRSAARHLRQVRTTFRARLAEHGVGREEIRVRLTLVRILIEGVRITRDQLLNLD